MTILLVEDDETVRELLARVLRTDGYDVLAAASSGEAEALVRAQQAPIHLLVCDVCLPGESGMALAHRLAATCPDLRLLFMSGDHSMDAAVAHEAQDAEFMGKPFTTRAFIENIRQLLAG